MRYLLLLALLTFGHAQDLHAQDLYFPPVDSSGPWATTDPATLGWCPDRITKLYNFLDTMDTKAFILLKDGRIVLEHYAPGFTKYSPWYWASAGKTLTSTLVGIAQEEGHVDINERTSSYLNIGWTNIPWESQGGGNTLTSFCPACKESKIKVRHQLTMTTGLNDTVPNPYCTDPSCLQYLVDAGARWAYHTAPYTLLDSVIERGMGNGTTFEDYFQDRIADRIGMGGSWQTMTEGNVYWSNARSMARYGLLAMNGMIWDQDTILHDTAYFTAATTPSQGFNKSYGYLWWINGQESYMLPTSQNIINGPLMPHAPQHMFCGLGTNDQLLNVAPDEGFVLVRLGDAAYGTQTVANRLNDEIWQRINLLDCPPKSISNALPPAAPLLSPNPSSDRIRVSLPDGPSGWQADIIDATGRMLLRMSLTTDGIDVSGLAPGSYTLLLARGQERHTLHFLKD